MMDEREFERRVRGCAPRLFRICYALLPQAADREDAIQEALLKAWQRRGTLREAAYFETWLVRIAINECKTILRRRKRACSEPLTEQLPAAEAGVPDPTLREALYRLEPKLRLPLLLHHLEGYTQQETARLLGIPLGTLKYRLRRAAARLRTELEKGGYER